MRAFLPSSSSRGVALVLVLAFLVLISVFILGFFSSVSTELKYSKTAANSATANQLADSAVSLAMSQIIEGTRGADPQDPSGRLAWASQPGMIRTYDDGGNPKKYFKLYSSDSMVGEGAFDPTTANDVPADWASKPGQYVDLNAPVLTEDPNGTIQPDSSRPEKYSAVYPIVDPTAEKTDPNSPGVEGFSIVNPPGYSGSNPPAPGFDPTQKSTGQSNNPAPMPAQWLYVLQDGTLKPANNTGASKANPIVGRIAFWTDDESAKVNINTASEGVFWDTPRAFTTDDVGIASGGAGYGKVAQQGGYALCQPQNGEYQRYPGHPAMNCLSVVFGKLGLPSPVPSAPSYTRITTASVPSLSRYYQIAPRVADYPDAFTHKGSYAGTRTPDNDLTGANAVKPDSDRLYTSVDELMFMPKLTGTARITNASNNSTSPGLITKGTLEKARFFITANSSAPETTLFNTPRVCIWPVNSSQSKQSTYDKLSAFCSTLSANGQANPPDSSRYYFTRSNARSMTADYSGRNQALYAYLQAETGRSIPGFGGNFLSKYPQAGSDAVASDRDQILTSIFDYIRCTNLSDRRVMADGQAHPFVQAPKFGTNPASTRGAGEVVPIKIGNTQGFGRFATITQFAIVFYKKASDPKLYSYILLQFGTPMEGTIGYQSGLKYTIKGMDGLLIKEAGASASKSLGLPANATDVIEVSDLETHHGNGMGGIEGPAMAMQNNTWNSNTNTKSYPFASINGATVDGNAKTFSMGAATIQIQVQNNLGGSETLQTLNLDIPAASNVKMPTASTYDLNTRLQRIPRDWAGLIASQDTVLAVELAGANGNTLGDTAIDRTAGDMRMIAARGTVSSKWFRPHRAWNSTNQADSGYDSSKAHSLVVARGKLIDTSSGNRTKDNANSSTTDSPHFLGKLVAGATYETATWTWEAPTRIPGIPSRVNGVTRTNGGPGDWDTGVGVQKDGAFLNKPDEGDMQFQDLSNGSAGRTPYFEKDDHTVNDNTVFSPSRMVASPLMFGSIPTGVQSGKPWQTLLFCSKPEDTTHPGLGTPLSGPPFTTPPDYLIADLFWMPVVEPYAISQPFATAGKINMNYQIQPFTYIQRSTGVRAVMKAEKFLAMRVQDAANYKPNCGNGMTSANASQTIDKLSGNVSGRFNIDMDATLKEFDEKFDTDKDLFRSATQICSIDLIPANRGITNKSGMIGFWNSHTLTGDNVREKPYVDLYPRLTTKSNTYTVHVCVQTLKKNSKTDPGTFVDPDSAGGGAKDAVLSEYRGSSIIERYIDPNDPRLPDFATVFASNPTDPSLNIDQYYKFRVVSTKRFAP